MVAFSSSRRHSSRAFSRPQNTVDALTATPGNDPLRDSLQAGASRRSAQGAEVVRDGRGEIVQVRISRWRTLSAGPQRRLAEVRELDGGRMAIRVDRFADSDTRPSSEIWQLYDREGRLEAALQSTPDGKFGVLTDYRTRQACRLVRNEKNELETVETWWI